MIYNYWSLLSFLYLSHFYTIVQNVELIIMLELRFTLYYKFNIAYKVD